MPGQALLVELDDGLRALDVGLSSGDQVGLVGALPLDQEHELAGRVGSSDDPFGVQVSVETRLSVCSSQSSTFSRSGELNGMLWLPGITSTFPMLLGRKTH